MKNKQQELLPAKVLKSKYFKKLTTEARLLAVQLTQGTEMVMSMNAASKTGQLNWDEYKDKYNHTKLSNIDFLDLTEKHLKELITAHIITKYHTIANYIENNKFLVYHFSKLNCGCRYLYVGFTDEYVDFAYGALPPLFIPYIARNEIERDSIDLARRALAGITYQLGVLPNKDFEARVSAEYKAKRKEILDSVDKKSKELGLEMRAFTKDGEIARG